MSELLKAARMALEALQTTMDETNVNLSQNFDARNALRDALEAEKSLQERYAEAVRCGAPPIQSGGTVAGNLGGYGNRCGSFGVRKRRRPLLGSAPVRERRRVSLPRLVAHEKRGRKQSDSSH